MMNDSTCRTPEAKPKRLPRDLFVAEIEHLAAGGDTLDSICRRLHTNAKRLEKRLADAGRRDLLRRITPLSLRDHRRESAA